MKLLKDSRKEEIVLALLTGQSGITIDGVEVSLNPLKNDTTKRKEVEANKVAESILKLL